MRNIAIICVSALLFISCKAFMHGYTWRDAANRYQPVINDKDNFGYKRLQYTKAMHRHSALANFLDCICKKDLLPDAIYEYRTAQKQYGIRLYYTGIDSVYVYEEPHKNRPASNLKEARTMTNEERQQLATNMSR